MEKKSGFPVGRAILCGVIALLMIVANGAVAFFAGYLDNMYTVYEAEESAISNVSYEEALGENGQHIVIAKGATLVHKDGLKRAGFRWSPERKAWWLAA